MSGETCGNCYQFRRNDTNYSFCAPANTFVRKGRSLQEALTYINNPYVLGMVKDGECPEYRPKRPSE